MTSFNPFASLRHLPINESGLEIERAYRFCLVQNATSRMPEHGDRTIVSGPLQKMTTKKEFMGVLRKLAEHPREEADRLAAQHPGLDANRLRSSCIALKFGEYRHYDCSDEEERVIKTVETTFPQLYFVGTLVSYGLVRARLEKNRSKNETTRLHTNNWQVMLRENIASALLDSRLNVVIATKGQGFGKLPLVCDPFGRPHVCQSGDGLLSHQSGDVVWRLNAYIDAGRPKTPHFLADQTFVISNSTSRHNVRTTEIPVVVARRASWPCQMKTCLG
jgi:hypothetical protein